MKKLFFCAAALLAAISFSACSDDDEPDIPGEIVGTWQLTHEEGCEIDNGEEQNWSTNFPDEDGWYVTYTFNKDGSCVSIEYGYGNENRAVGTYSISGNTLTLKNADYSYKYEIKKLTESELVLLDSVKDSGYSLEATQTYTRIE